MEQAKAVSSFRLASLLRLQKDPELALRLFRKPNESPKNPAKRFRYSLRCYDLIITKLGRAKMFHEMEKALHELRTETRFVPKEAFFCNIMGFYGRAGMAEGAHKLFDEITAFRCQRSIKSFNSLLRVLLSCKQFDKARQLLLSIEKYGEADACTYNILVHWLGSNSRIDDALMLFDEMTRRGIPPTKFTFGTLIRGLCLHKRITEAIKLKDDMLSVFNLAPDPHAYSSLIKGLCEVNELPSALQLKEEIVRSNVELDSAIYSTLISGFFKAGRQAEALRLVEEMKSKGCKPDTVTCNVMINGFCKVKDFNAALKLLGEMMEAECKPDVISYNVILSALGKEGKWSEATDLFESMPKSGCLPDILSYRILFDALSDVMQLKEAAILLDEMIAKGFAPHSTSTLKFVDTICQERNEVLLWSVLKSLGRANAINIDLWRVAITSIFKRNKPSSAIEIMDTLN